jgi:hypothetical protein
MDLGDRIFEVLARVRENPLPALAALAVGLALGFAVRGFSSSDEQAAHAVVKRESAPQHVSKPQRKSQEPAPAAADAAPPADTAARVAAALDAVESYADEQSAARVGAAIEPLDGSVQPLLAGTVSSGRPWSVMKVPTAAAYLNFRRDGAGATSGESTIPSGSPEREGLGLALVESDNLAIRRRVQEMIAAQGAPGTAGAINAMLVNGGARPQISPQLDPSIDSLQLGTGDWDLHEAVHWFRELQVGSGQCLGLAADDRDFILRQLRAAPSALPWGAASVLDHGDIALKPGWGAYGSDYTVEQVVIVGNGSEAEGFPSLSGGYAMALMAIVPSSDPGALGEGQHQLGELAQLVEGAMGSPGPTVDASLAHTC